MVRPTSRFSIYRHWAICLVGSLLLVLPWTARGVEPALVKADIDLGACKAFQADVSKPVDADTLLDVLGLSRRANDQTALKTWSAGGLPPADKAGQQPVTFQYLIAFKRPMPLGAVLAAGEGLSLRFLREGSPVTSKFTEEAAWSEVAAAPHQRSAVLFTLPVETKTQAILLTDRRAMGTSAVGTLRLFKPRYQNLTPGANAYARHEYTAPNSPNTATASLITAGIGDWISAGKDSKGFISSPAISDINPEWFLLAWDEKRTISGLWLVGNVAEMTLDYFSGLDIINPRVGTAEEWKRVRKFSEAEDHGRWITFEPPLVTKGIRLNIVKTLKTPQIATIHAVHVFEDLAQNPSADLLTKNGGARTAPFRVPYEITEDGSLTLVVNDSKGRRARNLITRDPASAGAYQIPWDLKNEAGDFVEPGTYEWKAITHPQFELKYEFTVYPNVSTHAPENAPWLTGVNGPGGWMADHTPPITVCAASDRVYMGSYVAESGVSLIECDRDGKKLWGHHSFAAWTGPRLLDADEKTVYVGSQINGEPADTVWGVDRETKQVRTVVSAAPTAVRQRGIKGMAVHDGKLLMSISATENWLVNAAAAEDVDLTASFPLYRITRKPRVAYEIVPDPQGDFLRLFRLTGVPPGMGIEGGLVYIQSIKNAHARQHVVLAFQRPVPLGSVVFPHPETKDIRVQMSVLKPGAPFPPKPEDNKNWIPFQEPGTAAWDVIAAPEGTETRALRITFIKGEEEDDLLTTNSKGGNGLEEGDPAATDVEAKNSKLSDFGSSSEGWLGRLEGLKLLRRRFKNLFADCTVHVNSGKVEANGSWDAKRDRPLTESDPAIYAMDWKSAQKIRGVAIKEVDAKTTKIDVWRGDAAGAIDYFGMEGWETVGSYQGERRNHWSGTPGLNHMARYMDGYVDLGREIETRAIRLRVIEQWPDNGPIGVSGVRTDLAPDKDRSVNPARCQIFGVAPVQYIGGEPDVDRLGAQRIEIRDAAKGTLIREIPIERPGQIAVNSEGTLYAIVDQKVVQVDDGGAHQDFISDLKAPVDLVFDSAGLLYVFDGDSTRQQVRVYDATGKYLRSIGKPGGLRAGKWDPEQLGTVTDIDVDDSGHIWIVENQYFPKRITRWTTAGKYEKEFLGNTPYGGGGALDPTDKTRLFHGPLEFELDWKTGASKLKNLTWIGNTPAGDLPIHLNDRLYLVTTPTDSQMSCAIVYLYEDDHLKLAAAIGGAAAFEPLKRNDLIASLGGKSLLDLRFRWSDLNGNGSVDVDEIVFTPSKGGLSFSRFNRDLAVHSGTLGYYVKEFLPSGVPVYEERVQPNLKGFGQYQLSNGSLFHMGYGDVKEGVLTPEGDVVWTYANDGNPGVQASQTAKPWTRSQILSEFGVIGHETAETGDLGEFIILHSNTGAWQMWTHDGLLIGPLFRDLRDPLARPWSMPQHNRKMLLKDLTIGEEHFAGYVCRTLEDNKFYAIAGHNHISLLEILGFDKVKRYGGKITVTADDVLKSQEWDREHEATKVYERAPVVDCYRLKQAPEIDGKLDDWNFVSASIPKQAEFRIGYDDTHLFVAYSTYQMGPFKNSGDQWDRMFKSGACVDLQIGVDPESPLDRVGPEAGDVRLLFASTLKKPKRPLAVLYKAVVPDAPASQHWRVVSPVGEVTFDEVLKLEEVETAHQETERGYIVEAAIPLAAIGLHPADGMRLKLDWGILKSGPDGNEVLRRIYWANQATSVIADAPTEARIHPELWGFVRFHDGNRPTTEDELDAVEVAAPKKGKDVKKDVDDILDTIKDEKTEGKTKK